eukprot:Clim_evm12s51 gene=Clim_evmTU12s51
MAPATHLEEDVVFAAGLGSLMNSMAYRNARSQFNNGITSFATAEQNFQFAYMQSKTVGGLTERIQRLEKAAEKRTDAQLMMQVNQIRQKHGLPAANKPPALPKPTKKSVAAAAPKKKTPVPRKKKSPAQKRQPRAQNRSTLSEDEIVNALVTTEIGSGTKPTTAAVQKQKAASPRPAPPVPEPASSPELVQHRPRGLINHQRRALQEVGNNKNSGKEAAVAAVKSPVPELPVAQPVAQPAKAMTQPEKRRRLFGGRNALAMIADDLGPPV